VLPDLLRGGGLILDPWRAACSVHVCYVMGISDVPIRWVAVRVVEYSLESSDVSVISLLLARSRCQSGVYGSYPELQLGISNYACLRHPCRFSDLWRFLGTGRRDTIIP
jgi:hypothetical protein